MNKKTKDTILIDIAVPNLRNLAKTITDRQKKYQELANEICAVKAKHSSNDLVSNIMYGSNHKVINAKSKET
jgi:hypothetical protein